MKALNVRQLAVRNSRTGEVLLEDVSFDIAANEAVGVVGRSGAGKSMLTQAILGLLPATLTASGKITWGETEMLRLSERARNRIRGAEIALLPQDARGALDPHVTAARQIERVARRHGSSRTAAELLKTVGLSPRIQGGKQPHQLSGGQCQMVAAAMVFACEPWLILADEPTSAIDVVRQQQLLELIADYCQEVRASLLFISHDFRAIGHMCESVLVIQEGRLIESGATSDVWCAPKRSHTKKLLRAAQKLSGGVGPAERRGS